MWDRPRPGLEPVSPALAGRFSTTVPPGKPQKSLIIVCLTSNLGLTVKFELFKVKLGDKAQGEVRGNS